MNDGIEEPKRADHFSAEALEGGWISWNLKDASRFNAFIEPLSVRLESPTEDGRPRARVRMLPTRKHSNLGDNVHGAVTLALVDIALFAASHQFGSLEAGHSVTLDLSTQFVGGGRLDLPNRAGRDPDLAEDYPRTNGDFRRLARAADASSEAKLAQIAPQESRSLHVVLGFAGTIRKASRK